MLKRLVNLPFAVATRAARAFQEREDAKAREKYGATRDPGEVANTAAPASAPSVQAPVDPAELRMSAAVVRAAQAEGRTVVLVDVREARRGESVPGSLHMPLSEVSIRVSELSDDQLVVAWGADEDGPVRAVAFFRERGIEDAWILDGNVAAWKKAGGSVEVV